MGLANVAVCFNYRCIGLFDPVSDIPAKMRVIVHPSQSPVQVERERADCIRQRKISAKFHYETDRQTALWLKLHERYASSAGMAQPYTEAANTLALTWPHSNGSLVALGCGGGEKEMSIFNALPKHTTFIPTDVSKPLVIKTALDVRALYPSAVITPLVFDLATANDLLEFIDQHAQISRIYTFFGLIPNFSPKSILPRLRMLLRPEDRLLLSANLAPNSMDPILPQYDNDATREWLSEFPKTHGAGEGKVKITVESEGQLQYIAARYHFQKPCVMEANGDAFEFHREDAIQLFTSYRYTLNTLANTLESHGITIKDSFQAANGEEGVFLCGL